MDDEGLMGTYKKIFFRYMFKEHAIMVLFIMLLIIADIGLSLAKPRIMNQFIDMAKTGASGKTILLIAIQFLGVVIFWQVVSVVKNYISLKLAWASTNKMKEDLMDHCVGLDLNFHNQHTPGEMVGRIDDDVNVLLNFFSTFTIKIITSIGLIVGIIFCLFRIDYRVGIGLGSFAFFVILFILKFRDFASVYWEKALEAKTRLFEFIEQRVNGLEDISKNGGNDYVFYKLNVFSKSVFKNNLKTGMLMSILGNGTGLLFFVGRILALIIGTYLFKRHVITATMVYIIYYYNEMLAAPIDTLALQISELQKNTGAIIRINQLFHSKSVTEFGQSQFKEKNGINIEFKDVSFGYKEEKNVLEHINFRLEKGKTLGVMGKTGSGKTTITKLIAGFYNVKEGNILVNGQVIEDLDIDELRQNLCYITQKVYLFEGTIRENITLYHSDIGDEDIMAVIDKLGITEWFGRFKDGLDTYLSGEGNGISAGEAQLIVYIRNFLKEPQIIILDEATSRFDRVTESMIKTATNNMIRNRTAIIIAHKISTLSAVDDILIMDNGQILEYGEREELEKATDSTYNHLLTAGMEEVLL